METLCLFLIGNWNGKNRKSDDIFGEKLTKYYETNNMKDLKQFIYDFIKIIKNYY